MSSNTHWGPKQICQSLFEVEKSPWKARFWQNLFQRLWLNAKNISKVCFRTKSILRAYYNLILAPICIWDKKKLARVTSDLKNPFRRLEFDKTSYKDFFSTQSEFLRLAYA